MFKLAATATGLAGQALAFGDFDIGDMYKTAREPVARRYQPYGYETLTYDRHFPGSPEVQKLTITAPFTRKEPFRKYKSRTVTKKVAVEKDSVEKKTEQEKP